MNVLRLEILDHNVWSLSLSNSSKEDRYRIILHKNILTKVNSYFSKKCVATTMPVLKLGEKIELNDEIERGQWTAIS